MDINQIDKNTAAGKLFICATPIGNLDDITFRVLKTLREVDLIAAEDTRHSIKLLNYYDIKTPMTSYHEYNKVDKARVLVEKLCSGLNVALITDAGTPAISDPGEELVKQCILAGIEVTSLPGACAALTALTLSGLSTRRFVFEAFLPSEKENKRGRMLFLEQLVNETRTIVLYEAPHHLITTLEDLYSVLGDRRISICKELTKIHESVLRIGLSDAIQFFKENEPRGEYVLVIEGKSEEQLKNERIQEWEEFNIKEHVQYYLGLGYDKKNAMKMVAKDRGISRRDVYKDLLSDA